jgi:methyltransferase
VLIFLFAVLQALRVWVIGTLGPYWTTRIITLEDAPLVRRGPYRFVRHPNYWIVAAEIAVLPLAFGGWSIALIWTILNALLLRQRVRVEEHALRVRADYRPPTNFPLATQSLAGTSSRPRQDVSSARRRCGR